MPVSYNGWTVLVDAPPTISIGSADDPTKIRLRVHPELSTIFAAFVSDFDRCIEDVDTVGHECSADPRPDIPGSTGSDEPDDWGYAYRHTRGASSWSNHSSGTAIDLNAAQHPRGARETFTAAQVAGLRELLARYPGIGWGGDYQHSPVDEMHFEWTRSHESAALLTSEIRAREAADMLTKAEIDAIAAAVVTRLLTADINRSAGGETPSCSVATALLGTRTRVMQLGDSIEQIGGEIADISTKLSSE